jgi:hypothetical protein
MCLGRINLGSNDLISSALCVVTALAVISGSAWAKDCSVSKTFEISRAQVLSGILQDRSGAVLSGVEVELLSGKHVVQSLRTSNAGAYDLGEVAPRKYRLRLRYGESSFCAPDVKCTAGHCQIARRVRINPKYFVQVD